MVEPALAPRNAFRGVIAVWIASFVAAVAIGILLDESVRAGWILIAFGGAVLASFAVQLWYGRAEGFTARVAASTVGSLLLMGAVSAIFAIISLTAALSLT